MKESKKLNENFILNRFHLIDGELNIGDTVYWHALNRPHTGAASHDNVYAKVLDIDKDAGIIKVKTVPNGRPAYKGTFAYTKSVPKNGRVMSINLRDRDVYKMSFMGGIINESQNKVFGQTLQEARVPQFNHGITNKKFLEQIYNIMKSDPRVSLLNFEDVKDTVPFSVGKDSCGFVIIEGDNYLMNCSFWNDDPILYQGSDIEEFKADFKEYMDHCEEEGITLKEDKMKSTTEKENIKALNEKRVSEFDNETDHDAWLLDDMLKALETTKLSGIANDVRSDTKLKMLQDFSHNIVFEIKSSNLLYLVGIIDSEYYMYVYRNKKFCGKYQGDSSKEFTDDVFESYFEF